VFENLFTPEALTALSQVIMIDLVLAGDNAIVIGLAAAGLPKEQRGKAIMIGILAATVLRIIFALLTTQLLQIIGLLLVGGLLLLWVCWKMFRELRAGGHHGDAAESVTGEDLNADGTIAKTAPTKTLSQAAWQIVIADVSMSLDNVLAVAGAAHEFPQILVFGLVLSIALMGLAATFIAKLLNKHRWIAYVGLVIILYVALEMIWKGGPEVLQLMQGVPLDEIKRPLHGGAAH
jgi:YjbE family integral membrane protein